MSELKAIRPEEIAENPFKLIGKDWMLITAGTLDSWNTMTASWGGMGTLWDKDVCLCFVRPTRHTHQFMEKSPGFTLSFFDEKYRDALTFCGSQSGRNVDKAKKTGLTPVAMESGAVYFEQTRLVIECTKIYFQDMDPANFLDAAVYDFYASRDYHRMYIGEVVKVLARDF
jgi:flavin reductase (DIM6/NTAB) family NADH-FMN oxidoreductase RutF